MEVISFVALILLSLVGYSSGAVGKAGKSVELKPQVIDLILVLVIWAGAAYFRIAFDLNKWLMILVWVVLSSGIGVLAIWPRQFPEEKASRKKLPQETRNSVPSSALKRLWHRWEKFSQRMGNFQSRILLSLFFFVFVSPLALAVKISSDPLGIKRLRRGSHWLPKAGTEVNLEQFRRQF